MKTIKVKSKRVNETAEAIVKGNTVVFAYEYEGSSPLGLQFKVMRGVSGEENYTGQQELGGQLQKGGSFTSFNLTPRKKGDGVLLDNIYEICQDIIDGNIKKEDAYAPGDNK